MNKDIMHLHTQANSYPWRAWLVLTIGCLLIGLDSSSTIAQPISAPPPAGVAQPYSYGTSFSGTVERYLLNPAGLVDGFILRNGIQVKFPPHMSNSLIVTVKPGDSVTVTGTPGIPNNFGQQVRAKSITNTNTQRTVVNQPPAYPPTPPADVNVSNLSVEGTARHWLVGRRGEINGVVLSDGAQVMFSPSVGYQLLNLARLGVRVKAQGFGLSNNYGQILRASALTVDGQALAIYNPAFGPQAYGRKGGRKRGRGLGSAPALGLPPGYNFSPGSSPPPAPPASLPPS